MNWILCSFVSIPLKDGSTLDQELDGSPEDSACHSVSKIYNKLNIIRRTSVISEKGNDAGSGYIVTAHPATVRQLSLATSETKLGIRVSTFLFPIINEKEQAGFPNGYHNDCNNKIVNATCSVIYGDEMNTTLGVFREVHLRYRR